MPFQFQSCVFEEVPYSYSLKTSKRLSGRYSCWGWEQAHYWDHERQEFLPVEVCDLHFQACFKINYSVPIFVVVRLLRFLPEHPYIVLHTRLLSQHLHFALLRIRLTPKINTFKPNETPSWYVPVPDAWEHLLEGSL